MRPCCGSKKGMTGAVLECQLSAVWSNCLAIASKVGGPRPMSKNATTGRRRHSRPRDRGSVIAQLHRTPHLAKSVACWHQVGVGFSSLLIRIWFYFTGDCPRVTPNVASLWPSRCAGQAPDLPTPRQAMSPDGRYWPYNGPADETQPAQFHPVASLPSGA